MIAGCSAEKNTGTTRFFHGLTSRYNIYFNGNESFKAGVKKLETSYTEDYSGLLKIFEYSDPASLSVCAADMERAVQKASKVISLKSITAKPETKDNSLPSEKDEEFMNRKEYNEWVDDSYLLMGKARVYKGDFELAKATFSYNLTSSVDKEILTESTIWLARVYNETGNYNESFRILNELTPESMLSEQKALFYTTLSDLFMKQKRYEEAIDPLEKSLNYVSGKRAQYRLTYLLAQLYERKGDGNRATGYYKDVIKMNPPYDVEFNARISIAGIFDQNSDNPESIKKELIKMLKDSKNKEFLDQVYYALGNIYLKEGDEKEAIYNFKESAAANKGNRNQQAKTFLALADHYFGIPDYVNSGKYYDSAVFIIDAKYPDYQTIRAISRSLNELISRIEIIQREDSLQKVAKMNPEERNKLISGIIEQVNRDQQNQTGQNRNADMYNMGQYYENERRFQNNIEQEGRWYFYNQAALAFGRTEFRRRWGDRKLEDNWRRLNKARVASGQQIVEQPEINQAGKDTVNPVADKKGAEYYLRDLPLNDSLIAISNGKIAQALLESGKIYHENFHDNAKALESFTGIQERFPGSPIEPENLYNIYMVYTEDGDPKASTYKQRLIEKYPDNDFTRIITDPDYYRKKQESQKEAEKFYESAYRAYTEENFIGAISICDTSLVRFPKHDLTPKFMLLRSFAFAHTSDERTFKEELGKIVKLWPDTPESNRAQEIIAYLNKEIPQLQVEEDKQIAKEIYSDEKESPHSFILVIKNPQFNINQATFDVISYNIDNYTNNNYRTQASLVDDKYIMLTVSGFQKLQDAMDYYNSFKTEIIVRNPSRSQMITFIIGKSNLEALIKDKNPDRYMIFFTEKYLIGDIKK
jgi:tetratricopeptide (TPR) repeat protein